MRIHISPLAALLALSACAGPPTVTVHAAADLDEGVTLAADDLERLLVQMAGPEGSPIARSDAAAPACTPGEIHVEVAGIDASLPRQAVALDDERCGDGRRITVRGGGLASAQWAVYDLLRDLGVRFFHPEETFVPEALRWPVNDVTRVDEPSFQHRSFHAHRTHPIELSPPLEETTLDMAGYQRRWVDWCVAMKTNTVDGTDGDLIGDYTAVRGFERSAGLNLLNSQQGSEPVLDPDDPRPESEQLKDAIDARMVPDERGQLPVHFGVSFNPSEFTEADDVVTVERLTFISEYLSERWPDVQQWTTNHGTAAPPTEHYGVRYYDLPQFAPPALGVKVHTLMFYDLERPAHVYGNRTFEGMLAWTREQAEVRRIQHYPESSWWLTFDLPVPLYLAPATMEARQYDIELLRDLISSSEDDATGVYGHHIFSSGQEWGYWLIDWCFAQQSWDTSFTHRDCVKDFTGQLAHGDTLARVLLEVERRQVDDMRDPALVRFLVGSDDETEIAWAAGIEFHPLPPQPAEVLGFDDLSVEHLESRSLRKLREMADAYAAWADEVEATLPDQSPQQARYVREIRDGLAIFGLRAAHAVAVYESALALKAALAEGDLLAVSEAHDGVDRARAITEAARAIVRAREADYRYPEELTIVGGEPGTEAARENRSIYPYRYLGRTHRMFYWERPDDQLAALWGEGLELVKPNRRVLLAGSPLEITLVADAVQDLTVDRGDGTVESELGPHTYASTGLYNWVLDATTSTGAIHHEDAAAVVDRRLVFERGSLTITYPRGAAAIEGLMPGFIFGLFDDEGGEQLVLATTSDRVQTRDAIRADLGSLQVRPRAGSTSGPAELELELRDVGHVKVYAAELAWTGEGDDLRLTVEGEIDTGEVIDLLVGVGGFEPDGARTLVASLLEYTPETLPQREPFVLEARGFEVP